MVEMNTEVLGRVEMVEMVEMIPLPGPREITGFWSGATTGRSQSLRLGSGVLGFYARIAARPWGRITRNPLNPLRS